MSFSPGNPGPQPSPCPGGEATHSARLPLPAFLHAIPKQGLQFPELTSSALLGSTLKPVPQSPLRARLVSQHCCVTAPCRARLVSQHCCATAPCRAEPSVSLLVASWSSVSCPKVRRASHHSSPPSLANPQGPSRYPPVTLSALTSLPLSPPCLLASLSERQAGPQLSCTLQPCGELRRVPASPGLLS